MLSDQPSAASDSQEDRLQLLMIDHIKPQCIIKSPSLPISDILLRVRKLLHERVDFFFYGDEALYSEYSSV